MILYQIHPGVPRCRVERASSKREWMDNTQNHYAYRCLPLTIANMMGYHIFLKKPVTAFWDGNKETSSIRIDEDGGGAACSIFGHGIITFHVDWLISTDDNTNIFITGPSNHYVNNAQALTGVYETDWAPFSFTMNWQLLHPGHVRFETTDPVCHFFPIPREYIESVPVSIRPLSSNPALDEEYRNFDKSRLAFIKSDHGTDWQKNYFKGQYTDGRRCPISNHQTKINLPEIRNECGGVEEENKRIEEKTG